MNGEKVHFSCHGAARMYQLFAMPVSQYVDVVCDEKPGEDTIPQRHLPQLAHDT